MPLRFSGASSQKPTISIVRDSCKTSRGTGVPPVGHGQEARATLPPAAAAIRCTVQATSPPNPLAPMITTRIMPHPPSVWPPRRRG